MAGSWLISPTDDGLGTVAPQQRFIDGFSEGFRNQFQPSIAVDQATGTLVVSMYDTRNDASRARAAMIVTASNDGGAPSARIGYASKQVTGHRRDHNSKSLSARFRKSRRGKSQQ